MNQSNNKKEVYQIVDSNNKLVNYTIYTSLDEAKKLIENLKINYNEFHDIRVLIIK